MPPASLDPAAPAAPPPLPSTDLGPASGRLSGPGSVEGDLFQTDLAPTGAGDPLIPGMHRDAFGYPEHESEPRPGYDLAQYVPLSAALSARVDWDAHTAAYSLPSVPRRLATERALEYGPTMVLFLVDVDGPKNAEGKHTCPDWWWRAQRPKIDKLREVCPGGYVYCTRGGYRIVYRLANPITLRSLADDARWTASYCAWLDVLQGGVGIVADRACANWGRLYRLPHTLRDGVRQELETIGDPQNVGVWNVEYVEVDITRKVTPTTPRTTSAITTTSTGVEGATEILRAGWPAPGNRTEARGALAGGLAMTTDMDESEIADFVFAVDGGKYSEAASWARDSVRNVQANADVPLIGWKRLGEILGADVVRDARRALGHEVLPVAVRHELPSAPVAVPAVVTGIDVTAALALVKNKRSQTQTALADAGYARAILDGDRLDRPSLEKAAEVAVRSAPGASRDQLINVMLNASGGLASELPQMIEAAQQAVLEREASLPLNELVLETTGPRAGKPVAGSQHNMDVAFRRFGVAFRFDRFARRKILDCGGTQVIVEDPHVNGLMFRCERELGFYPPTDKFTAYCTHVAWLNAFHPVRDYLDALPAWDGVTRAEEWLIRYGGAEDSPYVRAVSRLVLVALVRRVRQPGCKFDEMLILEGEQGSLKSSALKALCPDLAWFTDDFKLGLDTKTQMEHTKGKWVVEAGELKGMSAADVLEMKSNLSRTVDEARMAYGREPTIVHREFVFIGTTNEGQYLRDPTGDRRYWPVRIPRAFDLTALRADRDQIWAEASYLNREHPEEAYIRLSPDLYAAAADEQTKRRVDDTAEVLIEEAFGKISTGKIKLRALWPLTVDLTTKKKPSKAESQEINTVMTRAGWVQSKGALVFPDGESKAWVRGTAAERERPLTVRGERVVEWVVPPTGTPPHHDTTTRL